MYDFFSFEMSVEMFDYMDAILDLQTASEYELIKIIIHVKLFVKIIFF